MGEKEEFMKKTLESLKQKLQELNKSLEKRKEKNLKKLRLLRNKSLFLFHLKMRSFKSSFFFDLLKKHSSHILIILGLVFVSLTSSLFSKEKGKEEKTSLDHMIPEGFVLMPIELANARDIKGIIGSFGVADLYAYHGGSALPNKQAASSVKLLPPDEEEGRFSALVPEKQASLLFEYQGAFYAVAKNPKNQTSKIYKNKKKKKSLVVIEESFE